MPHQEFRTTEQKKKRKETEFSSKWWSNLAVDLTPRSVPPNKILAQKNPQQIHLYQHAPDSKLISPAAPPNHSPPAAPRCRRALFAAWSDLHATSTANSWMACRPSPSPTLVPSPALFLTACLTKIWTLPHHPSITHYLRCRWWFTRLVSSSD